VNIAENVEGLDESSRWAFVVGAPRCGTTAIANWLRGHPDACLSTPKEPHFFAMRDLRGVSDDELRKIIKRDYLDRFFPNRSGASLFAEGSVSYLYMPEQIEPVVRLWPEAKFIICLRNPLEMVPSLHQRHFVNGDETVREFEQAWSLVAERREGRSVPRSCLEPRFLDYWESGSLGKHATNFVKMAGRERCLFVLFEDLQVDPRREFQRVLDFLDLPEFHKAAFERHAESRDCRIPWLQRLLQRPPRAVLRFLADSDDLHNPAFAETPGPFLQKVLDLRTRILDWNEIPVERPVIASTMIDKMRTMYRDDVAVLSTLLKRDLSHWMDPAAAALSTVDARRTATG
jgi:hypothetical protein